MAWFFGVKGGMERHRSGPGIGGSENFRSFLTSQRIGCLKGSWEGITRPRQTETMMTGLGRAGAVLVPGRLAVELCKLRFALTTPLAGLIPVDGTFIPKEKHRSSSAYRGLKRTHV